MTAVERPVALDLEAGRARGRVRTVVAQFGPAFVVSVAYIDPGNFATNFAGGARHGYQLAWVILLANAVAVLVQYVSAKVGLATGRSLPELCRTRFGRRLNVVLWLQAELVAMATDVAEVVGSAVGLHIVFGMPLLPAGVVAAVIALVILGLEQHGYRRFELVVMGLLGLVASGFVYLLVAVGGQHYGELAAGLVPRLQDGDALDLAVGIMGATVMPHVVYLHSALPQRRTAGAGRQDRRTLLRFLRWDCAVGLTLAGIVNLSMLCVAAALFRSGTEGGGDLAAVHASLGSLVGGGAALAFGVALMTSGLSSASVGAYAGQVVMAGFMSWRVPLLLRRILTLLPSLAVLAFAVDTGSVLVYSQIALSLGIPFALVPLLLIARDARLMRDLANRRLTTALSTVAVVVITGLNAVFLLEVARQLF